MWSSLADLFSSDRFMPHGMCLLWEPGLLGLHVVSDAVIALAYFTIPLALLHFARRRSDLAYPWMFSLFALFILGCGATHVMGIWVLWRPDYGADGLVKAVTALASIGTAFAIWQVMPAALALPGTGELKAAVARQTAALSASDQAHADAERRFRDFAAIASDWLWETDAEHRFSYVSPRAEEAGGTRSERVLGRRRDELAIVDRAAPDWQAHLADLEARREFRNLVYGWRNQDGGVRYARVSGRPVFDDAGRFLGYRGAASDVTAEVEADQRADRALALLQDAVESLPAGFILFDRDERLITCNGLHRALIPDAAPVLVPGTTLETIVRFAADRDVILDSHERKEQWVRERLTQLRRGDADVEQTWEDGRRFHLIERRTSEGGLVSIRFDVTQQRQLDEQLRQAQKMEAVGQLTGGVAHDFNNLLTVIAGNLEMLEDAVAGDQAAARRLAAAARAAERGAALTQRLLTFARRQSLNPRNVDLNALVSGMGDLLHRSLGESVELQLSLDPGLWPTRVDPAQVENALLNLAINARDAMPRGGKLTVETGNRHLDADYAAHEPEVVPGHYVMLAVSDTGVGMSAEVLERAFEPFFTTKQPGQGTGLGLSTIYGFAKQSGGHVKIYSEPGLGTTVRIYLRRTEANGAPAAAPAAEEVVPGGRELVLVVEDDPDVRALAVSVVSGLGYRVLEAADGPTALAMVKAHADIDLLFTDMVMPGGMGGNDLARAARAINPRLATVFTSGYTEAAIFRAGEVEPGLELLSKPYRRQSLGKAIRTALDRRQG
jgi:PAS domain S-box-containing protein